MELIRALGSLVEPPVPPSRVVAEALGLGPPAAAADHSDVFDLQLPPYASVYLGPDGMLGGESRDRIAGFWRALNLTPPPEPDHLAVMLSFHAGLTELESDAVTEPARFAWRRARAAFFWEHLASWLPGFLGKVGELAYPFYSAWAELLHQALRAEAALLGPPDRLSSHLAAAPDLPDPRDVGLDDFVASLLIPVRSGVILVRSDFQRGSQTLGVGIRIAERRVVLRSLLSQDAGGTLAWLAAEASTWANRHRECLDEPDEAARFWVSRAEKTGALLGELAAEQGEGAAVP